MTSWLKRAEMLLESVDEMAAQKLKEKDKSTLAKDHGVEDTNLREEQRTVYEPVRSYSFRSGGGVPALASVAASSSAAAGGESPLATSNVAEPQAVEELHRKAAEQRKEISALERNLEDARAKLAEKDRDMGRERQVVTQERLTENRAMWSTPEQTGKQLFHEFAIGASTAKKKRTQLAH
jgi:hypothetical protein